jgi:AcrR family transcriptional regulator
MTATTASPPDGKTQDRRVRKTRQAIRTALRTLLQDAGIDQVTIKDIAHEADVGYTTFFRHYLTKEAAIGDFADSAAAELLDQTMPLLSTDGLASTVALCRNVDANRHVWKALLTGGAADFVRSSLIVHTLERSKEWPVSRSWPPQTRELSS